MKFQVLEGLIHCKNLSLNKLSPWFFKNKFPNQLFTFQIHFMLRKRFPNTSFQASNKVNLLNPQVSPSNLTFQVLGGFALWKKIHLNKVSPPLLKFPIQVSLFVPTPFTFTQRNPLITKRAGLMRKLRRFVK